MITSRASRKRSAEISRIQCHSYGSTPLSFLPRKSDLMWLFSHHAPGCRIMSQGHLPSLVSRFTHVIHLDTTYNGDMPLFG